MRYSEEIERRANYIAMLLFEKIRDDLNPLHFNVTEILEEGFDTVLYGNVSKTLLSNEAFRIGRVNRALSRLIDMGMIEEDTEEESYFSVISSNL